MTPVISERKPQHCFFASPFLIVKVYVGGQKNTFKTEEERIKKQGDRGKGVLLLSPK